MNLTFIPKSEYKLTLNENALFFTHVIVLFTLIKSHDLNRTLCVGVNEASAPMDVHISPHNTDPVQFVRVTATSFELFLNEGSISCQTCPPQQRGHWVHQHGHSG